MTSDQTSDPNPGTSGETPGNGVADSPEQAQHLPDLASSDPSMTDDVASIAVQVRSDAAGDPDQLAQMLRTRLTEAGIDLPDDEVDELIHQLTEGETRDSSSAEEWSSAEGGA